MGRLRIITKIYLLIIVSCAAINTTAQVQVRAGFVQDSIRLGDQLDYYLTARYPSNLNVIFPDSTFSFDPFEFHRKKYQPTITQQGESYDSVVYQLVTFEIDDIQYLSLPVFVINEKDCTRYVPLRDSILLTTMVKEPIPDSVSAQDLPLLTNTAYQRVSILLNYPVLLIAVGILLVVSIIVWIVFGKRIRKHFRLKRLQKNHSRFISTFSEKLHLLQNQFTTEQTEAAFSLWKKYLEQLEGKPYTKLTTRETITLEQDEQLGKSLKAVDRAIYGRSTDVIDPLAHLKNVAESRFTKTIEDLRNG